MRTTHLLALFCAASLTGCLESEATLELSPNGGGTLAVDVTLDLARSTELLAQRGMSQEQAAQATAADLLKRLHGVDAWSDLRSEVTESGRIHFRGKAWFKDAGALTFEHDAGTVTCALEVGASEAALRLDDERGSRLALALLEYGPRALEQVLTRRFGEARPTLRALQVKVPGAVQGASYAWGERDANGATIEDSPAGWEGLLERYQERAARLEQEGKLDAEGKTLKQVQMLFAIPKLRWTIDPEAGKTFAADYAAAVAAWEGSAWRPLLEGEAPATEPTDMAATEPTDMAATEPTDTAEPADTAATEPTDTTEPAGDAFEENDVQAQAKPITAGLFEDLLGDGQDWFQVEIQPGQTLKIGLEKAPDAHLGLILLAGGNLRREPDAVEWSNSAAESRLAQFVVTGRGHYHLSVALE